MYAKVLQQFPEKEEGSYRHSLAMTITCRRLRWGSSGSKVRALSSQHLAFLTSLPPVFCLAHILQVATAFILMCLFVLEILVTSSNIFSSFLFGLLICWPYNSSSRESYRLPDVGLRAWNSGELHELMKLISVCPGSWDNPPLQAATHGVEWAQGWAGLPALTVTHIFAQAYE